ncbi:MAG: hypothetical protein QM758_11285 [Armatimonas sp.]
MPRPEADTLLFSNNPERIEKFQTLYVGRLKGPARLLYHHQSAMDTDTWFTAELINDGDEPCEVQVVGGDAGPVRDTIWVGYRVASEFFTAHNSDSGMVVVVPPALPPGAAGSTPARWANHLGSYGATPALW